LNGARAAFERAIKIWEANLGAGTSQVATGVNNLGMVDARPGRFERRTRRLRARLKIDEAAFVRPSQGRHPRQQPGQCAEEQGDLNGRTHRLRACIKNLGKNTSRISCRMLLQQSTTWASVLKDLGDLSGARAAFERAIKILEDNLGTDHPQVATGVNNPGGVLKDLGDLNGARAAYERAIKFWKTSGTDHPQVATGVNNPGLVMKDQGDLNGARAAFERALKIFKKFCRPIIPV